VLLRLFLSLSLSLSLSSRSDETCRNNFRTSLSCEHKCHQWTVMDIEYRVTW
jgi:hypothetical protein